jgi:hypothetical protein
LIGIVASLPERKMCEAVDFAHLSDAALHGGTAESLEWMQEAKDKSPLLKGILFFYNPSS